MPASLNDKLSFWAARSVDRFRRFGKTPEHKKRPLPRTEREGAKGRSLPVGLPHRTDDDQVILYRIVKVSVGYPLGT